MRNSRFIGLAAIAGLALAFGAACGDDDDAETTMPTSETTSATTGTRAATTASGSPAATLAPSDGPAIRLGFSAWPGWFPWQVAEEAGILEAAGIEVELTWFDGYLDSINAFAAGQLDGNTQTLSDTIASVGAGSDQVIVLVNDNSTGNDQVIVTEDIQTIEGLEGKTIGLEAGVVDHYLLLLGLESVGLSPDDVTVQNLLTDAAAATFAAGQLDGVAVFAPFTTTALERPGSHTLFSSADFPGAIPDHLVLSRELVESRPEDVQRLVNAWFMTLEYMEANPEEATEIMAERAGVSVEDYESYEAGTTLFSIEDNLEAFEEGDDFTSLHFAAEDITAFLLDTGLIEEEVDLEGLLDPTFVEAYAESQD